VLAINAGIFSVCGKINAVCFIANKGMDYTIPGAEAAPGTLVLIDIKFAGHRKFSCQTTIYT
jgi:hypothetical protein